MGDEVTWGQAIAVMFICFGIPVVALLCWLHQEAEKQQPSRK
jgi:hypothetical protein